MLTTSQQRQQLEDALVQASRDKDVARSAMMASLPILYGCSSEALDSSAARAILVTTAGSRIAEVRKRIAEFDVAND